MPIGADREWLMAWLQINEQTRPALLEPVRSELTQDLHNVEDALFDVVHVRGLAGRLGTAPFEGDADDWPSMAEIGTGSENAVSGGYRHWTLTIELEKQAENLRCRCRADTRQRQG
jgi:hypothetical protein